MVFFYFKNELLISTITSKKKTYFHAASKRCSLLPVFFNNIVNIHFQQLILQNLTDFDFYYIEKNEKFTLFGIV